MQRGLLRCVIVALVTSNSIAPHRTAPRSPDEIQHLGYFLGRSEGVRELQVFLLRICKGSASCCTGNADSAYNCVPNLPAIKSSRILWPVLIVCTAGLLYCVQGIKLNEDALYIEIHDQDVPSASETGKPEL